MMAPPWPRCRETVPPRARPGHGPGVPCASGADRPTAYRRRAGPTAMEVPMNRRIPTLLRRLALLGCVAAGLAGCVAYPVGPYYGRGYGRPAPGYAYAAPPRYGWGGGGGYHGGWGYDRRIW